MNMINDATQVARHEAARAAAAAGGEFLTFRLGAEEYGIDILKVQEIRSYEQPTRIANAPAFVKFMYDHQCPSFMEYGEYPFFSADEIKKALKLKAAFSDMLDLMQ